MAKALYPEGAQKIFEAVFDWVSNDFTVGLLPSSYVYDVTDVFKSDLGTIIATAALSSKTNTNGVLDAADPTFTAVAAGSTVGAIVIWKDTGVAGTSPLLLFDDTLNGLPYSTDGNDIAIRFSDGASKILRIPTTLS